MIYWMCQSTKCEPTDKQLEHAIKRNFGGLQELDTYEIFMSYLKDVKRSKQATTKEVIDAFYMTPIVAFKTIKCLIFYFIKGSFPDCSPLGLIETSLSSRETTGIGYEPDLYLCQCLNIN